MAPLLGVRILSAIAFCATFCAAMGLPAGAAQEYAPSTFALLPLVAGDPGLPYSIFPTVAERTELGGRIERDVARMRAGRPASDATVVRAVTKAGFDQDSAYRSCEDADCARTVGRALHVDCVIFGSVTRYLAMIWAADVSIVDVKTGRVRGPYALGYKGDYESLSMGVGALSQSLSRTLISDALSGRGE
jgi:hypothetical protein